MCFIKKHKTKRKNTILTDESNKSGKLGEWACCMRCAVILGAFGWLEMKLQIRWKLLGTYQLGSLITCWDWWKKLLPCDRDLPPSNPTNCPHLSTYFWLLSPSCRHFKSLAFWGIQRARGLKYILWLTVIYFTRYQFE